MSAKRARSEGKVLFLGKRFYTNKDAWKERFGRVYHLPFEWSRGGEEVVLWLLDYHTRDVIVDKEASLRMVSTPMPGLEALKVLIRMLKQKPGAVVASGDTYIGLLGWVVARLAGARFVLDIYDKYDEFPGYVKPLGFDLFKFVRSRSDFRIYASHGLADLYAEEHDRIEFHVAPNGVDPALFRPMPMSECRRKLELDPVWRLVGYFGSMEPDRGVRDLVDAIASLRRQGGDIKLLVCGKRHVATPLDEEWILYRGVIPHEAVPEYMNACDLLVVPYRNSAFMDMGASCKIAEYLMCARPVVSTKTPNFVMNFPRQAEELGAVLASPGDAASLAKSIDAQLKKCVVSSIPDGMSWASIAAGAAKALRSPEACDDLERPGRTGREEVG